MDERYMPINNTDMIKISRVMTVYTIKFICVYVYNSVLYVYDIIEIIMKYFIYVLQARFQRESNLPAIHFIEINEFDVM